MNFAIPMAGYGQRFVDAAYTTPKPLLEAHGKTLLEWSVDSLPLEICSSLVFVGLEAHNSGGRLEGFLKDRYGNERTHCVWLPSTTRGQAETVLLGSRFYDAALPLVIFNIDTIFVSRTLVSSMRAPGVSGVLGAFRSDATRFSYARLDEEGRIAEVREKSVISPHALTGLYHFESTEVFSDLASDAIERGRTEKGEFYVAPLYNTLIESGAELRLDVAEAAWIVGTPEEYELFRVAPLPAELRMRGEPPG